MGVERAFCGFAGILADRISGFDGWRADRHVGSIGGAVAMPRPGMDRVHAPRPPRVPAAAESLVAQGVLRRQEAA
jgi:hypothetical protein